MSFVLRPLSSSSSSSSIVYSQFLATDFLEFESILFFVIYRNGHFLGVAFDNVQYGPGLAYFPAASLSYGESCQMNFGASPFKYSFYCC